MYNCHTHTFNMTCAPDKFLSQYMGNFFGPIIQKILTFKVGRIIILGIAGSNPWLRRYASFVQIGTLTSQNSIFQDLVDYYPPGSKMIILAFNMDYMGAGKSEIKFEGQIDQLIDIKKKYPNTCLPVLGIDPRMPFPYKEFASMKEFAEQYMKWGFIGLKMYPSTGFFPYDPRLEELYAFAEANGLPITTHCTKSGVYYMGDIVNSMAEPDNFSKQPFVNSPKPPFKTQGVKKSEFSLNFLHPDNYRDVLANFPNLKINIAHYGGSNEMKKAGNPESWYEKAKAIILEKKPGSDEYAFPNVYTDISYTLAEKSIFAMLKKDIETERLGDRILFGTDFYMTQQEKKERYLAIEFANYAGPNIFKKIAVDNPERFLTSTYYRASKNWIFRDGQMVKC